MIEGIITDRIFKYKNLPVYEGTVPDRVKLSDKPRYNSVCNIMVYDVIRRKQFQWGWYPADCIDFKSDMIEAILED